MRQGLVRTPDGTARSKGQTRTGRGQWMILPVWRHTAKNCEPTATLWYNCGQWRHLAKSCLEKESWEPRKGRKQGRTHGEGKKAKWPKVGGGVRKARERKNDSEA